MAKPKSGRRSSKSSSSSRDSSGSQETYESRSTAATSTTTRTTTTTTIGPKFRPVAEDISPATSCCPRSSVETYDSRMASDADLDAAGAGYYSNNSSNDDADADVMDWEAAIPPLPSYRGEVQHEVQPSTPSTFAKLFPSLNRLSIRHDEFTSDGNMNLRVDTVIPGGRRHRVNNIQLFHLRMYDLGRRDFSLRRYCRDSGREVCKAKRKFAEPSSPDAARRPTLQRSMSSAIKALSRPQSSRSSSSGSSLFGSNKGGSSPTHGHGHNHHSSLRRTNTSYSSCDGDDELGDAARPTSSSAGRPHRSPRVPTSTISLEFSNYARVDVTRRGGRGSKRYEFEWWGHRYGWKRVTDKNLDVVSFHLLRDGQARPIAHIVPETRSPDQVLRDESANGWVPPCYMWISDSSVLEAMTDVADVIVATGLVALVDDCIKETFQPTRKVARSPAAAAESGSGSRGFMQSLFGRRHTDQHSSSPLRFANPISAY